MLDVAQVSHEIQLTALILVVIMRRLQPILVALNESRLLVLLLQAITSAVHIIVLL